MTSGARTTEPRTAAPRRDWLAAALGAGIALAAWPCAPARAGSLDLEALMALLAQRRSGEARFTEERIVKGFDSPLRASGTLSFSAPERFARHTLEPRPESMEVSGNLLVLRRGGRTRQMALDAVPELLALVQGLRGTLAGDAALLLRHFEAQVSGDARRWSLALRPLEAQVADQVRGLQIAGTGSDVRSVEVQLAGGDRSLMIIEPAAQAGGGAVKADR